MVTINGVKAQNLQAVQQENVKKPTMNEVLSRMQSNFEQTNQTAQNKQNCSNTEAQTKSPFDNIMSMFQGENSILLSMLPMLLTKQKNENLGKEIIKKMLANSGNPMLAKLVEMLSNINKKTNIQNTEQTIQSSKIDDFAKVEQ